VIVDAIGVTKSLKTASQPLITKPGVPLKDLAMGLMMGARDEDTVRSLAGRLARLNKQLDEPDQGRITELTGGVPLTEIVGGLLSAIDPDTVEARARELAGTPHTDPGDELRRKAQEELVDAATRVFTGELVDLFERIRREREQTLDHENLDHVLQAGWDQDAAQSARTPADEFESYLREHRDEIDALAIYFDQPYRRRELTYEMICQVLERLRADRPKLAPLRVWQAYSQLDEYRGRQPVNELTALVALIRRVSGLDETLTTYDDTVRRNFQNWVLKRHSGSGEKFNDEQMEWLRMIRDHVSSSFHMERDDLEMAPFDGQGGLGRMYQLFGTGMDALIEEVNEVLAA
jgi:type I restriction enzyme R subunit